MLFAPSVQVKKLQIKAKTTKRAFYSYNRQNRRQKLNQHIPTFGCHVMVVYNLPKKSGNFRWDVNGKTNFRFPNGKFPKKTGFFER